MITSRQKRTAQAIVSVFENGTARLGCGTVTCAKGDAGGLSYGRFQITTRSGGLFRLIRDYCETPEALCGGVLRDYLDRLRLQDSSLNTDALFRRHLLEAGMDPTMRRVQDSFFQQNYWNPAVEQVIRLGLQEALSVCAVFDSHIHGSWSIVRKQVESEIGSPQHTGERPWVLAYLQTRRSWLANHRIAALHATVYRMDSLLDLAKAQNWALTLPLRVHGVRITIDDLPDDDTPPHDATDDTMP
jgi:chitosanase